MFNNLYKTEENWVLFYDLFSKNNNGDSIRPIAKRLRELHPEYKFFFVTSNKKKRQNKTIEMADEVLVEKSLRMKYVFSKCKYVISPMGFPEKGRKKKGQIFVQTWHGSPIKKLYLSRNNQDLNYQKYSKQFKNTDYFCAQSEYDKKHLSEAFALSKNAFIDSGLPRNDILFSADDEFKTNLKEKLNLPISKKIILYCPTWRRYDYKTVIPFDLNKMKEALSKDYILLMRSHVGKHSWVDKNNNPINIFDNEFVFDGGIHNEISELYTITDVMISDYSSSVFDFAITKKPQILYVYDLEEYQKEFGLYFDYKDFPFPQAKNTKDLINYITGYPDISESYTTFVNEYLTYENGKATDIILEKLGVLK